MEAEAPGEMAVATERAAETDSAREGQSLTMRQLACVGLSVVIADLTLFRGHGYAGVAAMGIAAIVLLWFGKRSDPGVQRYRWIVTGLLIAAALKLVWGGSLGLALFGGLLLSALAVALEGRAPSLTDTLSLALGSIPSGVKAIVSHRRTGARGNGSASQTSWLSVILPLVVVAAFGAIFIMANPDLAESVWRYGDRAWSQLSIALGTFSGRELLFWLFVGLVTLGLLQPLQHRIWTHVSTSEETSEAADAPSEGHLDAYRNTLLAAIVLFAVYLVFEFRTLWFRDFPEGFYYGGYAHQGAAWLTIALGLTTAILSVMFRGSQTHSGRLARLRPLAWIWSVENLILAVAVYNRMWIYIQFNGMTRMRTVGLLGITAVVVGLLLMLRRLVRGHDFRWLVQRYVWTVGLAILLYLVLPVDMLAHGYNMRRVLGGDLPPVVQLVAHPIDSGGALVLPALIDADDPIIRDGIRAMLADRHLAIRKNVHEQRTRGWTAFQLSDVWLKQHLDELEPYWSTLLEEQEQREQLLKRFHEYAMQWY